MKKIASAILGLAAALLSGCIVTSVSPFYFEKDLATDPALIGDWIREIKDKPSEVWKLEPLGTTGYRLTLIEERSATVLEAHLFKLQGQLYLDLASMDQDYHVIPPHYLLKITQLKPELRMAQIDHDWLKDFVRKNPAAVRHHPVPVGNAPEERRVVLTGTTSELQSFVTENLKAENVWKGDFILTRKNQK